MTDIVKSYKNIVNVHENIINIISTVNIDFAC